MSLDVHPESFRSAPGQADPSGAVMDIVPPVESPRWWVRGTLLAGVVTVLAVAGVILRGAIATPDAGPRLTHTVTRGDVVVTVTEEGLLESSENHEIKCRVRGQSTVIWVVESGTYVEPGDVLVRLDTLFIEEQVNERTKYAHWSRSAAERSKADVLRDTLAISEYEDGRFVEQLALLEKDLAIAESNLRTQQNMLRHVESLFERGFRSGLVVQETKFKVRHPGRPGPRRRHRGRAAPGAPAAGAAAGRAGRRREEDGNQRPEGIHSGRATRNAARQPEGDRGDSQSQRRTGRSRCEPSRSRSY